MALNTCNECTTSFAVGIAKCPHCGSKDYSEEGSSMPKITLHGGPSNAAADADTSPDVSAAAPQDATFSTPEGDHQLSPDAVTKFDVESEPEPAPASAESEPEKAPEPEPDAKVDEVQDETKSLDDMTLAELRSEADSRGLASYGSKSDLRKRLEKAE
jgi:RNA polymerase subunit RPABC4/transcription elongation factor Spt4